MKKKLKRTKPSRKKKTNSNKIPLVGEPLSDEEINKICNTLLNNDLRYASALDDRVKEFLDKQIDLKSYPEALSVLEFKRILTGVKQEIHVTHSTEEIDLDNLTVEELDALRDMKIKAEGGDCREPIRPETLLH